MTARPVAVVALGVVAAVTVSGCSARPDSDAGARPWAAATVAVAPAGLPDEPAAVELLRSAATRAAATSFEAVSVNRDANGTTSRLLVVHRPQVGTVIADSTTTRTQGRLYPTGAHQPSVTGALRYLGLMVDRFGVVLSATRGSALGRAADVVEARDGSGSVEARFWVDRQTGLMVRRDVISDDGTVRTSEFTDLRVPATDASLDRVVATATTAPELDAVALARIRAEGWPCPEGLPGGLSLTQAQESDGGAVHLVYSDGIEIVSLFVQRGRLDLGMPGMQRREIAGGTVLQSVSGERAWVWSSTGSVLTLITDSAPVTAERIIAALPPDPSS